MIKPIMRDMMFLAQPSEKAVSADKQVITDLMDTRFDSYGAMRPVKID